MDDVVEIKPSNVDAVSEGELEDLDEILAEARADGEDIDGMGGNTVDDSDIREIIEEQMIAEEIDEGEKSDEIGEDLRFKTAGGSDRKKSDEGLDALARAKKNRSERYDEFNSKYEDFMSNLNSIGDEIDKAVAKGSRENSLKGTPTLPAEVDKSGHSDMLEKFMNKHQATAPGGTAGAPRRGSIYDTASEGVSGSDALLGDEQSGFSSSKVSSSVTGAGSELAAQEAAALASFVPGVAKIGADGRVVVDTADDMSSLGTAGGGGGAGAKSSGGFEDANNKAQVEGGTSKESSGSGSSGQQKTTAKKAKFTMKMRARSRSNSLTRRKNGGAAPGA